MKTIGKTTENRPIVEMTPEEHRVLWNLARALDGDGYEDMPRATISEEMIQEIDLAPAFEAIVTFARGKALINSIRYLTNQLDEVFMHRIEDTSPQEE